MTRRHSDVSHISGLNDIMESLHLFIYQLCRVDEGHAEETYGFSNRGLGIKAMAWFMIEMFVTQNGDDQE